jgi:micrococcal nuclease
MIEHRREASVSRLTVFHCRGIAARLWIGFENTYCRLTVAPYLVGGITEIFIFIGNSEVPGDTDRAAEMHRVARVIDGDTIVLIPNEKVRLIGVDAPETAHPKKIIECFGKDAKEFMRAAVEGKTVRFVLDEANAVRNHKDRYGRTLGYLYTEDGSLLNAELIRRGYAHAYTRFPFRYIVEFREMERQARTEAAGFWSSCRRKRS